MKTVKTCELIGPALDWAVAEAIGLPLCDEACQGDFILVGHGDGDLERFAPSTDWSHGGPLLEKYKVVIETDDASIYWARLPPYNSLFKSGSNHLIAACRAIVAAKLGETVQIPEELWTAQNDTTPTCRPYSENARATN